MQVNKGYIANNVSQVELILPESADVGDMIHITGKGAGGWRLTIPHNQYVHYGQFYGDGTNHRYLRSNHYLDGISLVCITANTNWKVVWSVGNIEIYDLE